MNDNRCGHCYPTYSGKYVLVKFEGEKVAEKMALINYVHCDKEAGEPELIAKIVDKFGVSTDLILRNCHEHSYKTRGTLQEILPVVEPPVEEPIFECFPGGE